MQYVGFWLVTLVLAGTSAAYLLYPILVVKRKGYESHVQPNSYEKRVLQAIAERDSAYSAISELDQDLAEGNLNHADYQEMRLRYKEQAVTALIILDQERARQNEQAETIEKVVVGVRRQLKTAKDAHSKTTNVTRKDRTATKVVVDEEENEVVCYCKLCKHKVGSDAIYCSNCGTNLSLPEESGV